MQTRCRLSYLMAPAFLIAPAFIALTGCHRQSDFAGRDPPSEAGWAALTAPIATMHAVMSSVQPSGHNDVDFADLMLVHHQAAIDMAKAELLFGTDPQMRRLALEVVTDQQSEMALMQLWVKRRSEASTNPRHPLDK
jgi:uncharacterized protein (DUF305 family)